MGENAEFVREWNAALNRGDFAALAEDADPEIEWVVAREHPDATTHRGIDAVLEYLREWLQTMPDFEAEIVELEESGDRVLAVMQAKGTGAGSGAVTEVTVATLSTFRDGVPIRTQEFLDLGEARAALADETDDS